MSNLLQAPAWIVATQNTGKLAEIRVLLADLGVEIRSLDTVPGIELPAEGDDYERNAVAKARAVATHARLPALGDDSGLEVDALGGRPGVHSARYGGPGLDDAGRVAFLLRELAGVPESRRQARFVCVVALVTPEGDSLVARGECPGRILEAPRGRGGFGYDPVFVAEGYDQSMAELASAEKNALSHRGRALVALRTRILSS